jgi:hypothetical protein
MTVHNLPKKTVPNSPEERFLRDVRRASRKYRHKATQARHQYVCAGLCTAGFSSLVPVAAATSSPRWVIAVFGAVVVTGHGFFALTRPHERAILYERAGNMLRLEIRKYEYCSDSNKTQAWKDFVTRVLLLESGFLQQETNIDASEVAEPLSPEFLTGESERKQTRRRPNDGSPTLAKVEGES